LYDAQNLFSLKCIPNHAVNLWVQEE